MTNRVILYGSMLAVFLVLFIVAGAALPRPQPAVMCDETAIVESQMADVQGLATWVTGDLVRVSVLGAISLATALYLQLGFWVAGRWAVMLTTTTIAVSTYLLAWYRIGRAQAWAAEQVPSCLEEALRDAYVSSHVAWAGMPARAAGSQLDLHWTTLLRLDAMAFVVLALGIAFLAYRGVRRVGRC